MYLTMRKYLFLSRSNRINAGSDENDYSGEYEDGWVGPSSASSECLPQDDEEWIVGAGHVPRS